MPSEKRFINVRTGEVIEITGTDAEISKVATVTATGRYVRPRAMKTSTLKTTYLNRRGTPWKSAYVALRALPEDHPMAQVPGSQDTGSLSAPDFETMNDAEVSAYGEAQKAQAALHTDLFDKAKAEISRRHPEARPYLRGDHYIGISPNVRFDAKVAKVALTPAEYASILVLKPDPERARAVLPPARYKLACKDHGNKVEIRRATENDRRKIAEIEAAARNKTEVDMASLSVQEDPFVEVYAVDPAF